MHITKPAGDRAVTRLEVDVEVRQTMTMGRSWRSSVRSAAVGMTIPLDIPRHATSATARQTLYLEDLDIEAGISCRTTRGRAIARQTLERGHLFLDIKPFEQEFSLAQSQSMAGSGYNGAIDEAGERSAAGRRRYLKLDRRAQAPVGLGLSEMFGRLLRPRPISSPGQQTASSFRDTMRDPRSRLQWGPRAGGKNAMASAARAMGTGRDSRTAGYRGVTAARDGSRTIC